MATQINIYYSNNKKVNNISQSTYDLLHTTYVAYLFDVLGLNDEEQMGSNEALEKVMELIIDIRKQARDNKDWPTSDKIRDTLKAANITIKDGKDGTTYEIG